METPSKSLKGNRLLYRGSLSLPDSHLLLDGLSFTVKTGDAHASPALLNNTLALTLESLRGLPLHLIGTVKVTDTWIDSPDVIYIDIHPTSTLTRVYFENIFCLAPISAEYGRTEYGIRVSLTDDNDQDTPDVLIYGELREPMSADEETIASTSKSTARVLHLLAARILPGPPPPPSFRLPRPDDPTPRRPPLEFGAKRKRGASSIPFDLNGKSANGSKRPKMTDVKGKARANVPILDEEAMRLAAAEVMRRIPKHASSGSVNIKALGKDARVGVNKAVFKVPNVPVRRGSSETDVFGGTPEAVVGEKENKMAVKKVVTRMLSEHGVGKTHSEFKELFQMCYQGTSFALRRQMSSGPLDSETIDRFVDAHVVMYVRDVRR